MVYVGDILWSLSPGVFYVRRFARGIELVYSNEVVKETCLQDSFTIL